MLLHPESLFAAPRSDRASFRRARPVRSLATPILHLDVALPAHPHPPAARPPAHALWRPAVAMEDVPMPDAQNAPADAAAKQPDQKAALTPPTSEDMDRGKREGSSSELSELELDDDEDIGEIEPDHYWDGGRIPVFKPVCCAPFPSGRPRRRTPLSCTVQCLLLVRRVGARVALRAMRG